MELIGEHVIEFTPLLTTSHVAAQHRFVHSPDIREQLEAQGTSKWMQTFRRYLEIAAENGELIASGGYPLEGGEIVRFPAIPTTKTVAVPDMLMPLRKRRFSVTEICIANVDTMTAALVVGDAIALNFANPSIPGGGYLRGAPAQEEDLCRLCPQLHPSLAATSYPIRPNTALVTERVLCCRQPGTYTLCQVLGETTFVSAAMPEGSPKPGTDQWSATVSLRIRAVLHACKESMRPNVILGAFGCGAFGNPAADTAAIFREQLQSSEFKGAFRRIVFAIIDPMGSGNLRPFAEQISKMLPLSL